MKNTKLMATLVALLGATSVKAEVQYQVTNLGTLGGASSFAYAINANGQVVGGSQLVDGDQHAFLYNNGTISDLGTLGGASSVAYGINNSGQIVGDSDIGAVSHAFLYDGTSMKDLTIGNIYSSARAINSSGQIAGSIDGPQGANAFIYSNGNITEISPLPGDTWARANAINDGGQAGGLSWNMTDPTSQIHAFTINGENNENLNPSATFDVFANAINAAGQIVGETAGMAFLYDNSTIINLGTLGGDSSNAYGISTTGLIVGSSQTADFKNDAFIYINKTMIDLNTLIAPSSGWKLESATAINDSGQIVGYGIDSENGQTNAFLLTPLSQSATTSVPEPSYAWPLTAIVLFACVRVHSRKII